MTALDAAQGETVVDGIHPVDRGCERIEEKLARGGARVRGGPA